MGRTVNQARRGEEVSREVITYEQQEPIMKYFKYSHLPEGPLKDTSMKFCALAELVIDTLPRNPERTVALRKLLEGKDAAVRSALP